MYLEGGIAATIVAILTGGFKVLSKRVDKKVDLTACKPVHEALNHNMEKGEKKFEELTRVQQKQGVILARIDERLIGMSKKLDNLNGGR